MGMVPKMAAMVVIMIKRKRRSAWLDKWHHRVLRRAQFLDRKIDHHDGVFLTMPISSTMPMMEITLTSIPNKGQVRMAPRPAEGRPDRMVMGWMKLSYSMPRIRR